MKGFMRWFKHMTDMMNDPKVNSLFEKHGHRGVLTYIWVLEIIAKNMDESDRCNLKTTRGHWAKMLRTYWKDADKILTSCRDDGLIFLTSSGDDVDISCPKLLKIRARQKPIGGKRYTLDIDTDVDKEYNTHKELFTPVENLVDNSKEKTKAFEKFYELYPKKVARGDAEKAWKKIDPKLYDEILRAVENQKKTKQLGNPEKQFIPYPASWLNAMRWKDEVEKNALNGSTIKVDPSNEDWVKIMVGLRKNPENFNLAGLSENGIKALLKVGGFEKLKTTHEDHMHFMKEDFKNAWLKS